MGSYGAVARGLQDPGRGLSPGLPDAPARRETVAGEGTPRPCICRPGLSRPLCPGGPEPPVGVGKERPWLPLNSARLSESQAQAGSPRPEKSGLGVKTLPQDVRWGFRETPPPSSLPRPASGGLLPGTPLLPPPPPPVPGGHRFGKNLRGASSRAPWLALHLMGARAGAQVSGDGGRPPGSRPPSAHALCFRRSWTGAETCSLAPCPFSFRVVRSARPLLPSGVRSHVGTALRG